MDGQFSSELRTRIPGGDHPTGWADLARKAIGQQEALHNEGELTVLLTLLASISPRTVLEIGTYRGGSAWAWSNLPSVQRIITVDTVATPEAEKRLDGLACPVDLIIGDSMNGATRYQVQQALGDIKADVVFIDGGHLYKEARADFEHYGQYGRPGGVIVMHDTQGYPGNDTVQVPQLWAEIAAVYRTTELIDRVGGPGGTGVVWL